MSSVTHLFVISLAVILTEGGVSVHNPFYCYSEDPIRPQNAWFGIHTGYETIRGQSINPNVSTCIPSKFWMLSRHGTRWPNPTELNNIWAMDIVHKEILSNFNKGRASLCAADIELLRNWQFDPNITAEFAQHLTSAGWDEMKGLAQRYQAIYPSILSPPYSPKDYLFRGSNFQHTQVSLHAFADGIFGANAHENVDFEAIAPDYLLRSYTLCPLYNEVILNLPERDAFREGPEYQEMTSQVSAKLGFHGSQSLRNNEVHTLSLICKYEQIWDLNVTSPLCSAFSIANRQVIEYFEDLEFYHRVGPGKAEYRRLFTNLVCFNMQELLQFLLSNDPEDHKARIYSSHVTILPMLLVNLGAFASDDTLTQHNFAQQTGRIWKTGTIISMGSNLAVIRYDCADGDNDVLFLFNEKPLQIAGCAANGLCKQSLIFERLGHWLDANCYARLAMYTFATYTDHNLAKDCCCRSFIFKSCLCLSNELQMTIFYRYFLDEEIAYILDLFGAL